MGVRISKSFKVAPGVRVRINTKSTSVSLGGKGLRYTVNSKGRRTTTVGIPGTGLSVQQVSGTDSSASRAHASPPLEHVVAAQAAAKPGLFAPKGEKRLYKILTANLEPAQWASKCEQVAEKFPDLQIAAATLAGLFALTENPSLAIHALGYVVDSGVEIAADPFLRRYAPVRAYSMDAGGGQRVLIRLSRELVVMWLATVHLVVGHLDQAEATAAALEDTPVAHELQRKIAAARTGGFDQTETRQVTSPERLKQLELLEELHSSLADIAQSKERVETHISGLEQMLAKLEPLVLQRRAVM